MESPTTSESRPAADSESIALASEVIESLTRVSSLVRDRVGDALLEANVNETRLTVMRNIAACGNSGCSQAELAGILRQAESSVCTLIERMKKDGLVHRFRSKQDRRKSFLMLTPDGQEQLRVALVNYHAVAKSLYKLWGEERTTLLRGQLDDLLFQLERPVSSVSGETSADVLNIRASQPKHDVRNAA